MRDRIESNDVGANVLMLSALACVLTSYAFSKWWLFKVLLLVIQFVFCCFFLLLFHFLVCILDVSFVCALHCSLKLDYVAAPFLMDQLDDLFLFLNARADRVLPNTSSEEHGWSTSRQGEIIRQGINTNSCISFSFCFSNLRHPFMTALQDTCHLSHESHVTVLRHLGPRIIVRLRLISRVIVRLGHFISWVIVLLRRIIVRPR
jgi:hypothetical protein